MNQTNADGLEREGEAQKDKEEEEEEEREREGKRGWLQYKSRRCIRCSWYYSVILPCRMANRSPEWSGQESFKWNPFQMSNGDPSRSAAPQCPFQSTRFRSNRSAARISAAGILETHSPFIPHQSTRGRRKDSDSAIKFYASVKASVSSPNGIRLEAIVQQQQQQQHRWK